MLWGTIFRMIFGCEYDNELKKKLNKIQTKDSFYFIAFNEDFYDEYRIDIDFYDVKFR